MNESVHSWKHSGCVFTCIFDLGAFHGFRKKCCTVAPCAVVGNLDPVLFPLRSVAPLAVVSLLLKGSKKLFH